MVHPEDEVFAITSAGGVIRTSAAEIKQSGRQTMGVRLVNLASGQTLVAIARNAETNGTLGGEDPEQAEASADLAGDDLTGDDLTGDDLAGDDTESDDGAPAVAGDDGQEPEAD